MKSQACVGAATFRREDNGDITVLSDGPFSMTRSAWRLVIAQLYERDEPRVDLDFPVPEGADRTGVR